MEYQGQHASGWAHNSGGMECNEGGPLARPPRRWWCGVKGRLETGRQVLTLCARQTTMQVDEDTLRERLAAGKLRPVEMPTPAELLAKRCVVVVYY
jgi:hypothetical protein